MNKTICLSHPLLCLLTEPLHDKKIVFKTLTEKLAYRCDCPSSEVAGWLSTAGIEIAVINPSSTCIPGTQKKWRSAKLIGFQDRAGVQILI